MAGGSAKRTAAQNETTIRNLRIGFLATSLFSLGVRTLLRRISLSSSITQWFLLLIPFVPSYTLFTYLTNLGTPVRDNSGTLLNPGGDLNLGGITEWCFDILYITWLCQIGSALLGGWFNWLYCIIPLFAFYKAYTGFIGPFLLQRASSESQMTGPSTEGPASQSKRQQKLQQRADKGDPRVKSMQRK